jgi:hypothetical protein
MAENLQSMGIFAERRILVYVGTMTRKDLNFKTIPFRISIPL